MPQHDPATERPQLISTPVLDAVLLARVAELNHDYLDLLARERVDCAVAAQLQHFPERVARELSTLAPAARSELAAAPFTLYSLALDDERFWRTACDGEAASLEQRYGQRGPAWLQGPFCEAALMQAWRVATLSPLAARLVYAMSEEAARRLAATPPWRLKRSVVEQPALLTPRWPTNAAFWPDLVRYAAASDSRRLRTTQLLGCCLLAAELELPAERRRRMPASPASLSAPSPPPRLDTARI
jgi:hypothetical protein